MSLKMKMELEDLWRFRKTVPSLPSHLVLPEREAASARE